MCNHQYGALPDESGQCLLDKIFRFGIGECGCLIEHQNRSISQQRASDGETLTFTAGELHAAAENGVVAVG